MAKQEFMSKEEFKEKYYIKLVNPPMADLSWEGIVFEKSTDRVVLSAIGNTAEKVENEIYFKMNVVNYHNINK